MKINVFVFWLLILSHQVIAQQYKWTHYNSTNTGLASDNVQDIAIDRSNVKWIATHEGLNRFDGVAWPVYNESYIANHVIYNLAIDRTGNL